MAGSKLLAHFRASAGRRALEEALRDLARDGVARASGGEHEATVLIAQERDPLRRAGDDAETEAFDATLELRAPSSGPIEAWIGTLHALAAPARGLVDRERSIVQLGHDVDFGQTPQAPSPIRYQYCMRRRSDFDHAAYLERYERIHSRFGLRTRGIDRYRQFHVDRARTKQACAAVELADGGFDSVSELHIASMKTFFAALGHNAKIGAREDEQAFVDLARSRMWISDVVFRTPAPH